MYLKSCSTFALMIKRLFPILVWLPKYKKKYLAGDLSAGITAGIMLIPQGMAYAMIAGLPPVYGLYAALMPQIVYALMGTSAHLAVGPVAMDSLLVAAGLGTLAISGIDHYIAMAIVLALFMGTIQLVLGLLKMGFLVNFLSKPVISGFTSAAALIIGFSQFNHLLGVELERTSQFHLTLRNIFNSLTQINGYALSIGLLGIVLLVIFKKINKRIPSALLVVVVSILIVYYFKLDAYGIPIVGEIPRGLPAFEIPAVSLSALSELFPIALTLALVAFMEAVSLSKAIQTKHGYAINPNQELIALGVANIAGSFFKSYPTTGSFSRTAVVDLSGGKTGLTGLIGAGIVGGTLLFLTPLFYFLPNAILAAIILVAVANLIDIRYPKALYKNTKDEFFLLLITFLLTLFVGIMEGILFGTLLALLLLVYRTSKPHMAVLGKIKGTAYFKNITRFEEEIEHEPSVLVLRFDAQLYFGNKDFFKAEVSRHLANVNPLPKTIILKAEPINYIDSSALFMLENVIIDLKKQGITVLFSEVIGPTRDIIKNSKLIEIIGQDNFFVNTIDAYNFALHKTPKTKLQKKISLQTKQNET